MRMRYLDHRKSFRSSISGKVSQDPRQQEEFAEQVYRYDCGGQEQGEEPLVRCQWHSAKHGPADIRHDPLYEHNKAHYRNKIFVLKHVLEQVQAGCSEE